jgi:N-acetylglucosamine-6-phosphate deacetylase
MKQLKIYNAQIITPYRILKNASLLVDNGVIVSIRDGFIKEKSQTEIDAQQKYLSPGFIDIHVHGGGGADFMDGAIDAFLTAAETHAKYGTTSLLPTTLTSDKDDLFNTFKNYEQALKLNKKGARFLGLHLEGPYFAMNRRGAQDPRYIRNPDPQEYLDILGSYSHLIKRWSAAPELPGAIEFALVLKKFNIIPAIAHTDAVYEEVAAAFENGFKLVTHLYSGMSGVTRRNAFRYAGVIESAFIIDEMDVEIIADGIHLPSPFLRLINKIKGAGHIALVTDAMRGAGMPGGGSILGSLRNGLEVVIEDGVAKTPDLTAFAGSVATADRLVRTMISEGCVSMQEAVKMITSTPARIIGVDANKGSIAVGKDADMVIFDENIVIDKTIIAGSIIYNSCPSKAGNH